MMEHAVTPTGVNASLQQAPLWPEAAQRRYRKTAVTADQG